MKKSALLLLVIFFIMLFDLKSKAQFIDKYGDNLSTLDGIMKAYYDVVTVKKGGKISFERDSLQHLPNVKVGWVTHPQNGTTGFKLVTLKEYHQHSDASLEKEGFYEHEISRKVENFGGIYHVWSTYESRNSPKGKVIARGINSIELYFDGKRFWILGWFFDGESKTNPLPSKYLTK